MKLKRATTFFIGIAVIAALCRPAFPQERPRQVTNPDHQKLAFTIKATLLGHQGQVFSLAFSHDGKFLATASDDKENATRLWDTATGQLIAVLDGTMPVFRTDGRVLMTISKKTIKLWDGVSGIPILSLTGHDASIHAASFSPDGTKLVTGSEDGTVKLWDVATGHTLATLMVWKEKKLPRYRIISRALRVTDYLFVKFSPDQKTVLTNTHWKDSPAKLWDANAGRLQAELGGNSHTEAGKVREASFSPDGKFIETQNYEMVKLWETATGKLIKEFKIPFIVASFSPDSKWLGLIRTGKTVGFLNIETLTMQPVAGEVDTSFLNQLVFSPDSRTCVIGSGYKHYHATLIDVATGRVRAEVPLFAKWGFDWVSDYQTDSDGLSFHPSSKFFMGASHNSVRLWDVSDGTLAWETTAGRDPATFSLDGKLLATVGKDKKTVLLWTIIPD